MIERVKIKNEFYCENRSAKLQQFRKRATKLINKTSVSVTVIQNRCFIYKFCTIFTDID